MFLDRALYSSTVLFCPVDVWMSAQRPPTVWHQVDLVDPSRVFYRPLDWPRTSSFIESGTVCGFLSIFVTPSTVVSDSRLCCP
jgi:hypothetical protein